MFSDLLVCFFLFVHQRYPSLSVEDDMKDWTDVELDTTLSFGSMRETTTTMIKRIQEKLEELDSIGKIGLYDETMKKKKNVLRLTENPIFSFAELRRLPKFAGT